MRTLITNGRLIETHEIIENASILFEDGVIVEIFRNAPSIESALIIDARNNFIAPGFIDIHVHGGGGHDFMDGSVDAFLHIAHTHAKHGTTSMMPTTLTMDKAGIMRILDCYDEASRQNKNGASFIGMHIEGPYFAMQHRGAQDPRYIRNPDKEEYSEILSKYDCIKRWSVAPELDGALELGRLLASKNIIASIAHTDALYDDVLKAMDNGYSLVTHLYSAMNGVVRRNAYRYAGVVEAAFLHDDLEVEIIADGKHLPVALLQLVYKIKGASKTALITDAIRAAATTVSESILGAKDNGLDVIIEDDVAKLPDRTSFAGSVATADRLVRVMWKDAGIALTEVIRMISETPARIVGIDKITGSLAVGKDADLVLFDEAVNVIKTFVKGHEIL